MKAVGRVSPRRASHFLLLRQKKVTKEKATPLSATPSLRYGATCGARVSRGLAELAPLRFAQTAASPDPRDAALLGAARGGGSGLCFARPWNAARAIASLGLAMSLGPSLRSALCLSCPLSLWERARVRAPGLTKGLTVSTARSPHPSPLPEGEGARPEAERSDGPSGCRVAERSKGPNHPPLAVPRSAGESGIRAAAV